jgi:hypothetical protein
VTGVGPPLSRIKQRSARLRFFPLATPPTARPLLASVHRAVSSGVCGGAGRRRACVAAPASVDMAGLEEIKNEAVDLVPSFTRIIYN